MYIEKIVLVEKKITGMNIMKSKFTKKYTLLNIQAERDAGIREAECEREAMDVKYKADTKIESDSRNLQLSTASFNK